MRWAKGPQTSSSPWYSQTYFPNLIQWGSSLLDKRVKHYCLLLKVSARWWLFLHELCSRKLSESDITLYKGTEYLAPFINSFLPAKSFDSSVGKSSVDRLLWHSFHLLVWQSSNIRHFCILEVIKLYEIPLDCFSSFRGCFLKIHFLCFCTIN